MMPRRVTVFFHGRVGFSTVASFGLVAVPPPSAYWMLAMLLPVTSYVTSYFSFIDLSTALSTSSVAFSLAASVTSEQALRPKTRPATVSAARAELRMERCMRDPRVMMVRPAHNRKAAVKVKPVGPSEEQVSAAAATLPQVARGTPGATCGTVSRSRAASTRPPRHACRPFRVPRSRRMECRRLPRATSGAERIVHRTGTRSGAHTTHP